MRVEHLFGRRKPKQDGFLLLMLLVSIAILALLYTTQFWLLPDSVPKYSDPNALPWEEEFLIRNETLHAYGQHTRQRYSDEQPRIKETISFRTNVFQGKYPRGELQFHIEPGWWIKGSWRAEFTTESGTIRYKTITGTGSEREANSFKGNIAPSKVYQDEQGQDHSKLYIIAKGRFLLSTENTKNKKSGEIWGDMYLTGWIDTEYKGTGELSLVAEWFFTREPEVSYQGQSEKKIMTFEWEANPTEEHR